MKTGILLTSACLLFSFTLPSFGDPPSEGKQQIFSELDLQIAYELEELRLDIIRQETSTADVDGTTTTEKVDYHPLGFDLGNGLFYDLNDNLSLRVKHLFALDGENNFAIKRIRRVEQNKGIQVSNISAGAICREWRGFLGNDRERCLDVSEEGGTLEVTRNGRFCYQIVEEAQAVHYSRNRKGRRLTTLQVEGEKMFVEQNRRKDAYKQDGDEISLGRALLVKRNATGDKIEIYRIRRYQEPRLLYTIQKKGDDLFIKKRRGRTQRVEVEADKVTIHGRWRPLFAYERVD